MTHPAIKAAIEALQMYQPKEVQGVKAKAAIEALRALEGCVVIERGKLEGMKKGKSYEYDGCYVTGRSIGWNALIEELLATTPPAQMKGE